MERRDRCQPTSVRDARSFLLRSVFQYGFIEIPEGSFVKYELDKESGVVMVDRFLYTNMPYPFSYGFIPNTLAADGDPTDVLVLSSQSLAVGTVCPVRVIGMLEMEDEAGIDTKILAVPTLKIDPLFGSMTMEQIPEAIE